MTGEMKHSIEEIMKEAGDLLLSYWQPGAVVEMKKEMGYYTQADIECEQLLKKRLFSLVPADFMAEESGQSGTKNNGYRWVIDPLDGTTNFAHHIPYFCISIALTQDDEPIMGAIYNPFLQEFFYAEKDHGAFLNGHPITVSQPNSFAEALIGFGLSYEPPKRGGLVSRAQKIAIEARAVRHFGAVALDLANVACGRLDGAIFSHLYWWDVAAGVLLVTEAGGKATQFDGSALEPQFASCMAASERIYDHLKELVKGSLDS